MKCSECVCWWEGICYADPNWPAPCEYENYNDYEEEEEEW